MHSKLPPGPRFHTGVDASAVCPNCESRGMKTFYEVGNIPCHSTMTMPTRSEATSYPKGDLRLGFCDACGFICNLLFDPKTNEYNQRCEESQGFSATFNKFARELAQRYAKRYDLKNKIALEIGCGKGEWLVALCEESGGRGIGIDPSYQPGRVKSPALDRIQFIVDYYGPKYAHVSADFIACRHTLEHIQPTLDFVRRIRETIGTRPIPVFFELPEVLRELEEGAFWDIYYEHATYFSPGSLARCFRRAHFDVTHLSVEYANQYIILDATPTSGPTDGPGHKKLPLEDDMARLRKGVAGFAGVTKHVTDKWTDLCKRAHAKGEKVVVWGASSKGVSFLNTLGLRDEVAAAVDINTYLHGKFIPGTGHEILAPQELVKLRPNHVIVMNPIYTKEIGDQLTQLGVKAALHAA